MNHWDKIHKLYYSKAEWIDKHNPSAQELLRHIKKGEHVLDIGGGQGQDTEFFVNNGCEVTLLDGSQQAIKYARNRLENKAVQFVEHGLDKGRLPFEDAVFDAVYGHLSLHYFSAERTRVIFEEISRILKKQGKIFVVCNTKNDEEVGREQNIQLEEDFYKMPDGQNKRYFSVQDFRVFTKNLFVEKICDEKATTYKDGDKELVRFIGIKI